MALNHLDVFITRGLPKRPLPAILGSDGAGVVDAVGEGVQAVNVGDEVVLYPIVTCGRCAACQAGSATAPNRTTLPIGLWANAAIVA